MLFLSPQPMLHRRYYVFALSVAASVPSSARFLYDTWRNDWRRQENESTTFRERSGRYPDPD